GAGGGAVAGGRGRHGECRGRWLAVGRRGQRQDWRLVLRAGRHRGALPGWPQCRPHAGDRRRHLQAVAAALRRGAARQAVGDRQRRGARPARLLPRDRRARGPRRGGPARTPAPTPGTPPHSPPPPPAPPPLRTPPVPSPRPARPGGARGRPTGTGAAARPSLPRVLPKFRRGSPKSGGGPPPHTALPRGPALAETAPAALHDELAAVAPRVLPFMD